MSANTTTAAGKLRVRARIEKVSGAQKLVIRDVPYTTTTTSLIASIEAAVQKGKVSVSTISDFTADKVEIELHLSAGLRGGSGHGPAVCPHRLRGVHQLQHGGHQERPPRGDHRLRLPEGVHGDPQEADQGRAGARAGGAGAAAALAHPGADLHREPGLQEYREGHHAKRR